MVCEIKLRKIGNSVGVVLPKEVLARLNAGEGDILTVSDAPGNALRISASSESAGEVAEQFKAAEDIIGRYRNTLRELAK